MPWVGSEGFVDEGVWRPRVRGSWREGVWGLDAGDVERGFVAGWQVRDRPW